MKSYMLVLLVTFEILCEVGCECMVVYSLSDSFFLVGFICFYQCVMHSIGPFGCNLN